MRGYQHRISHQLVRDHQIICIEDTATANMTRSAKGTIEKPGRNVRQKSGLNRTILAQGLVRNTSELGIQISVVPTAIRSRPSTSHQPTLFKMRTRRRRQPSQSSSIQVSELPT